LTRQNIPKLPKKREQNDGKQQDQVWIIVFHQTFCLNVLSIDDGIFVPSLEYIHWDARTLPLNLELWRYQSLVECQSPFNIFLNFDLLNPITHSPSISNDGTLNWCVASNTRSASSRLSLMSTTTNGKSCSARNDLAASQAEQVGVVYITICDICQILLGDYYFCLVGELGSAIFFAGKLPVVFLWLFD
jgi:hypothetical protein